MNFLLLWNTKVLLKFGLYNESQWVQCCFGSFVLSVFFLDDPESDDGYNYKQMMARDERRFKMADGNGDHIADKEEFTAFLHPEEYEHMKDIVVLVGLLLLACRLKVN